MLDPPLILLKSSLLIRQLFSTTPPFLDISEFQWSVFRYDQQGSRYTCARTLVVVGVRFPVPYTAPVNRSAIICVRFRTFLVTRIWTSPFPLSS